MRAYDGHTRRGHDRSRNGHFERERTRAADDVSVLTGRMHPLDGKILREALEPLAAQLEREVLPDAEHGVRELVEICAGSDVEAQTIFSSGA